MRMRMKTPQTIARHSWFRFGIFSLLALQLLFSIITVVGVKISNEHNAFERITNHYGAFYVSDHDYPFCDKVETASEAFSQDVAVQFMNANKFIDSLSPSDFEELFEGVNHRIEHLDFCRTAIQDYNSLKMFPNLKSLHFRLNPLSRPCPDFSFLPHCHNLKTFYCSCDGVGSFHFTGFESMSQLKHVDLENPTPETVESVMALPTLEKLVLSFSIKFPQLKELNLVTEPCNDDFFKLSGLVELEKVCCFDSEISKEELRSFHLRNVLYFSTKNWVATRENPTCNWKFSEH